MKPVIQEIIDTAGSVILGKKNEIKLVVTCLLAKGHILIEDIPGVGKTTLSKAASVAMGMEFSRIQFTSDLLPGDVTGVSVFSKEKEKFIFNPGPLFAQVVLADELNRGTPRTQSALLEAMEEGQISIDGRSHPLPEPFLVIATQNQRYHIGTFPLPESQLDRFLMRLHLGYPPPHAEKQILNGGNGRETLKNLKPVINVEQLLEMQYEVSKVHISPAILDYVQNLLNVSREDGGFLGLSTRAGLALMRASQAWAYCEGRDYLIPEDVQGVAGPVLEHRLEPEESRVKGNEFAATSKLIKSVKI